MFGCGFMPGWMRRPKQGETREEESWGQHLANASLFVRRDLSTCVHRCRYWSMLRCGSSLLCGGSTSRTGPEILIWLIHRTVVCLGLLFRQTVST